MLLKRKAKRLPAQADDLALLGLVGDEPADAAPSRPTTPAHVRELLDLLPDPQRA